MKFASRHEHAFYHRPNASRTIELAAFVSAAVVEAAALERELRRIIDDDRYPLSPRIQVLREIRNMIRPEPVREPPFFRRFTRK